MTANIFSAGEMLSWTKQWDDIRYAVMVQQEATEMAIFKIGFYSIRAGYKFGHQVNSPDILRNVQTSQLRKP
jgi:hypothetical protein